VGGTGSAVMEACHHWQVANETGRVIVVCYNKDETHNGISTIALYCILLPINFLDWKEHVQVMDSLMVCQ